MKSIRECTRCLILSLTTALLIFPIPSIAQEEDVPSSDKPAKIFDATEISLEKLLNMEVTVASLFAEDELVTGATVSSINSKKWKQLGARRINEALNNEISVQTTPNLGGSYNLSIRGYTTSESREGVAAIIDGIPANEITTGSAFMIMPNVELGVLDRIELIKGPASAIYGSDAFHGILSMRTFESDIDHYSVEGAGAYPLYGDANVKISQGIAADLIRIDAAASTSHQGDQDLEFEYADSQNNKQTSAYNNSYTSRTGVFKVRIKPVNKLKIKLGAYATYFDSDNYPGISDYAPMQPLLGNDFSSADVSYYIGNVAISYELPADISIEANSYYKRSSGSYELSTSSSGATLQDALADHYGGEFSIKQQDNPINLQWFTAYSYTYGEIKDYKTYLIQLDTGAKTIVPGSPKGFNTGIHSVFSQLKWGAIKDRLYFLLGGRLDSYTDYGNQISPRGGIIFLPTKNSSIKALYSRAFKAPTQFHIYGIPIIVEGNKDIKPEKIDMGELIYIYKKDDFKINVTGFYSYWSDAITAYLQTNGSFIFLNKDKRDSIGGEFTCSYKYEPFAFDLGFSYVVSRAIDAQDPDNPTETRDINFGMFPMYSINAGLQYTLKPVDITFYLNNRLYLNVKDTNESEDTEPDDLPAYYRMDLNLSKIVADRVDIYFDIRNLLNRKNYVPSVYGKDGGFLEPGISVMLRAGYKL